MRRSVGCRRQEVALRTAILYMNGGHKEANLTFRVRFKTKQYNAGRMTYRYRVLLFPASSGGSGEQARRRKAVATKETRTRPGTGLLPRSATARRSVRARIVGPQPANGHTFDGVVVAVWGVFLSPKCNNCRSVALPGDPQAFATNGGILRGVPEHPALSARDGRMSAHPGRRDFLRDYTEINKISWRWAATLGSIVYMNNFRVCNLYPSCLELVLK